MAITYNAGTNTITVTGYTSGTPCTFLDVYNADVAGGWGKVTRQCTNQYCIQAKLQIGDGSTATWFGDAKVQVIFSGIFSSDVWSNIIFSIKANAHFRLGDLISGKQTGRGVAIHHVDAYRCNFIDGENNDGAVELYSCFVNILSDVTYSMRLDRVQGAKVYNFLTPCTCFFYRSSGIDVYNWNSQKSWQAFQGVSGTIDGIILSSIGIGFAIDQNATADMYVKNILVNNVSHSLLRGYQSGYDGYIINCTSDSWVCSYMSYTGKFYRQYEFNLHVKKVDKTLFANRPVTIWQRAGNNNFVDGDKFYEGTTDASGDIPTQTLTWGYYNQANGNTLQQYYHKILIEGDADHLDYETEFNPDYKRTEDITMVDVSTIVSGITDLKGTGFVKDTDSMVDLAHKSGTKGTDNIYDRIGAPTGADIAADIAAIPSDVWDEILTGATHNIPTSAGRRVREIGAYAIHSGTAQAGNSHSITLAAAASPSDAAYNGIYNRNLIVLTDNTGAGQTRTVVDYDAVTKIVVVDRDWRISPDATTEYQITPDDTPLTVDHGVVQGGTANTITIRDYASDDDDAYLCNIITIIAGPGRGQARLVDTYDGTTKVVTICGDDWVTTPTTSSVYVMMPYGVACAACMGDEALTQIKNALDAATSVDLKKHDNKITGLIL